MSRTIPIPSFAEESKLQGEGYQLIAGIDEVGRGALAGPVVAAAVILPHHIDSPWLYQVKDSKELSPQKRQLLSHHIHQEALAVGIGVASHEVIDTKGIIRATRQAMKLAVERLEPQPQSLLIDYIPLPEVKLPQQAVPDGDSRCLSIACASIIAKVARDQLMVELDRAYPGYGLAQHKGYGTEEHFSCLKMLGPSPIHRQSFRLIKGNEA